MTISKTSKPAFYITTTLPYVNSVPHVGHASEFVLADVRARFERAGGAEVVFNTGTDEHGVKIWQKAVEAGKTAQEYVDQYAAHFRALTDELNISNTNFIRTTDEHHMTAAAELWRRVDAAGYIYKKHYEVKYCIGCELEKTDSELDDGECPFHPGKELEVIKEENYFFAFSKFADKLRKLYTEDYPDFVVPKKRSNEIVSLVEGGLQDFSVSRLKEKMPWGIGVPGDDTQVMYVWFDALTNYISTLGWPENEEDFAQFWGTLEAPRAIQIAGKDNLRQQSAMWQAMLLAADLPTSRQVFINGFISVDGQKMSKSLGNVISPNELIARYGVDGTRYLLLTKSTFGEDSDISWDKMDAVYNSELANGLGNLTARIITLAADIDKDAQFAQTTEFELRLQKLQDQIAQNVRKMEMRGALADIWQIVTSANKYIEDTKPWELRKIDESQFAQVMSKLLSDLHLISEVLSPFLPQTAEKISDALENRQRVILFERVNIDTDSK